MRWTLVVQNFESGCKLKSQNIEMGFFHNVKMFFLLFWTEYQYATYIFDVLDNCTYQGPWVGGGKKVELLKYTLFTVLTFCLVDCYE
jgi:hypothetical protein